MEKFSKTIFINVGKNIVTQNFYFIKKKSSGIEKKKCNFNLITVSPKINVSHLNYSITIMNLIGRHLKKTMSDIPVQHALIQ